VKTDTTDGTGSGSCQTVGFSISGVQPLASSGKELVCYNNSKYYLQ
jgi:hypothetical protein